ncbi:MAG: methyl-accepting chemotaxis protein [Defluviitaleaceae bacterium]|nr:methyl-accepting chemotaxis protein [Defluviitaleaceae bacterium]
MWFKNLRIKVKLILSFAVVIALAIVLAVFAYSSLRTISESYQNKLEYSQQRVQEILQISTDVMDLRRLNAVVRADNGNVTELSAHRTYSAGIYDEINRRIETYLRLTRNDYALTTQQRDQLISKMNNMNSLLSDYRANLLERNIGFAIAGDTAAIVANNAAQQTLSSTLDTAITEMENFEIALSYEMRDSTAAQASTYRTMFVVMSVAIVLLSVILSLVIAEMIRKPLMQLVDVAENVSVGSLNVNIDTKSTDEVGMLASSFSRVIEVINNLVQELDLLSQADDAGNTDARINTNRFQGEYKNVAGEINRLYSDMTAETMSVLNVLAEFGYGNFDADIPKKPGKKAIMNTSLDAMRNEISSVNSDIQKLVKGALIGDLAVRADAAKYKGEWANIVKGLNQLMEEIAAPIVETGSVLNHVAEGRFDQRITGNYKGEFLSLKNSVNSTITNMISYISEISEILNALANNDLNQSINREYVGEFAAIKDAMVHIIDTLNKVIGEMSTSAEQISAGARMISDSSMALATGSMTQSNSVSALNNSIVQINESTGRNADNAKHAETLSEESRVNAAKGDEDMKNMLLSMDGIKESSAKITAINKTIQDIAFQTNLLALNASVEAARAGEHGRGFAVVADEVRSLANRSQGAARETTVLIEESISRVNEGTKTAEQTADALKAIVNNVAKVADIIKGISSASTEQADAIGMVTKELASITDVAHQTTAASEEAAAAAEELTSQSDMMHSLASVFKMKK